MVRVLAISLGFKIRFAKSGTGALKEINSKTFTPNEGKSTV